MQLIAFLLVVVLTFILRRRYPDHYLSIGRVSLSNLTLYDVKYSGTLWHGTYAFTYTSKQITVQLNWPFSAPHKWMTFTSKATYYTSSTANISTASIVAVFWFFPLLYKQTAGPWTDVEIEDLRIRVRKGGETPYFIQRLRENVVGAVLQGDIYRVDDFKTSVRFSGLSEADVEEKAPEDSEDADEDPYSGILNAEVKTADGEVDGDGRTCTDSLTGENGDLKTVQSESKDHMVQSFLPASEDELCISALARQLHLNNLEGRIYSFDQVDAQFRRNWTADRGSFVLIAKESRWVRIHWTYERDKVKPWYFQIFTSVVQFPYNLVHVFNYPMTTVNLYVSRVDVHFDEFKIRDAELLIQAISIVREKMYNAGLQWQDFLVDGIAKMIVGGSLEPR
ncbi:hypothetical protein EUX98_g2237 [Antrodiella citrinella]|uniref:Uncharacterized protein n=1 Tax=Antrodiella citrinella TaxID=2447956 RepID=A0A4V3XJ69_9APHY|nr:hypothetical protein EUX98_g2237 [Antrodiella citrinella]